MALRHDTPVGRLVLSAAGWLLRAAFATLGRTWRVEFVEGAAHLPSLHGDGPVILTFWHNRIVLAVRPLLGRLHRRGMPVTVLASGSREGELVARTVGGWGVPAVRGSATRGGRQALWGTYRALKRSRSSPVVVPDGPTGPAYRYKAGVLHLARLSGAPILPLGLAASAYWTVGSWDRLMIPRPFARIAVAVGEPRGVPRSLEDAALEAERRRREDELNRLTAAAERAAGTPGPPDRPLPVGRSTADSPP